MNQEIPEHPRRQKDLTAEESLLANNGGIALLPTWVRAVAVIGIPGAIALFLVWMGAREVPKIYALVEANHQRLTRVLEIEAQGEVRDRELYRMLQRICSNTSRTEDERSRCFD